MNRTYTWDFPLPRTHTGILQGNGTLGAMIWGEGGVLRITLGRSDLWDHRGGMPWTEKMSYANIRRCLEQKDEKGLRDLFEKTAAGPGEPPCPSIIPIGRIELDFGADATLTVGTLDIDDGTLAIKISTSRRDYTLHIALDMQLPVMCIEFPKGLDAKLRRVPAWETIGERLRQISFQKPELFESKTVSGWVQAMPADPPVCVAYQRKGAELLLAVSRGSDVSAAKEAADSDIEAAQKLGFRKLCSRNERWWATFWKDVPTIDIPNERLSFLYYYGMYKFATFTNPAGVPATLQGPWIEEYQMPPWCSDYHFNINVQMCYSPAYHGNRLEHLKPLFDLIASWTDILRHNAKVFLGIKDGQMLPHAVDDRCTCMGGFWTGSVDHGCTAWVALMMYRYFRYTMDEAFLRTQAYPFMVEAMRVYEGMLERDGDSFVLPVGVSPEYRGSQMDAWGKNASFQLACVHGLCEALVAAAGTLGQPAKPIWKEILEKLPKACLIGEKGREMIALWDGVPLEETHRHHSHLGGITPFDVFDFDDPAWREILERSIGHWIFRGPGLWSGWCVPWAAAIHTRFGNADAAETYLEIFDRFFTNEGHGTLHDCSVPGVSLMGINATRKRLGRNEIMQMDGGMGAVATIQEMMLHVRRGVNYVFAGAPRSWEEVSFKAMRTDGGFLVTASRESGEVSKVRIVSPFGGVFRIGNPWAGAAVVRRGKGTGERVSGAVIEIATGKGETVDLVKV